MTVLVTGATGFIGQRLAQRLRHHPDDATDVRALVLPDEPLPDAWRSDAGIHVVRGDITQPHDVEAALQGCHTAYHLAAVVGDAGGDALHQRVTVGGSWNLFSAAVKQEARVVLASSVVVYGDRMGRAACHEDLDWGQPHGPYSRAKQNQERTAWDFHRARGLRLSVVRPTNVYGPHSRVWVDAILDMLRRGLPTLIGNGHQNAGLVHVDNLVSLLHLAGTHPGAIGRAYNGCDALDVSWRRYISDLADAAHTHAPRAMPRAVAVALAHITERVWPLLRRTSRPPVSLEAVSLVGADHRVPMERARDELGFEPHVDYATGINGVTRYIQREA